MIHISRVVCTPTLDYRLSRVQVPEVNSFAPWRPLIILLLISLICDSCGKVGSPVAPARLTERTSNLSAIQRGSNIQLSWPAPTLVQNESSRLYISRVDIFRLTERRDEEPILDPDDYETAAQVVGFMDRAAIEAQSKTLGHLQFTDAINLTNSRDLSNARLRYAIRYANGRDQFAALSNTVAVEPTPGIALPPTELRVNAQQDAVILSWNPPSANIDGSSPASVVGYNVYRRSARRDTNDSPLNGEPVAATTFTDARFQYLTEYVYSVRALSQGATGLVESADSEPLPYTPVDTFQPSAPDPVSIASANGTISLFWPTSSERDVIGYNIYRANSPDAQSDAWTRLNEQPVSTVTYRDERVVVDQAYSYRVTAIDRFNNESQPSRVVTETAHP